MNGMTMVLMLLEATIQQHKPSLIKLHAELENALNNADNFADLINKTQTLSKEIEAQLHNGRDQLLELNSCRKESSDELISQINTYEHEGALWPYMETYLRAMA